jgi:hypothetical protein
MSAYIFGGVLVLIVLSRGVALSFANEGIPKGPRKPRPILKQNYKGYILRIKAVVDVGGTIDGWYVYAFDPAQSRHADSRYEVDLFDSPEEALKQGRDFIDRGGRWLKNTVPKRQEIHEIVGL